jgi:proline dehydrogenase
MLRQLLLYLSQAAWAQNIMTKWGVARRVARRFVAGETLDEAVAVTKQLNAQHLSVTLDYLGESVHSAADAQAVVDSYRQLLDRIHQEQLQASISLKLTHLGLDIGEDLCVTNLRHILTTAKAHGIGVTIDMESTAYTDRTLQIYRTMRDEYAFHNVGTVIQAYLFRSDKDMTALAGEGAHIRLCKGAYLESPTLAYPQKSDVDMNYVRLLQSYLDKPRTQYLCIATHDERMIAAAEQFISAQALPRERYEFQMLYGIRGERQLALAKQHTVRVYVPFGTSWYPYFVRRLAERPANLWFFARGFFAR